MVVFLSLSNLIAHLGAARKAGEPRNRFLGGAGMTEG